MIKWQGAQRLLDNEALSHAEASACIAAAGTLRAEMIHVITASSPAGDALSEEGSVGRELALVREVSILRYLPLLT